MTANDNRTSIETTVDELDVMDIGRVITFESGKEPVSVAGMIASLELRDMGGVSPYKLTLTNGNSYTFRAGHKVTIHKPGVYGPNHPIVGFHNVG